MIRGCGSQSNRFLTHSERSPKRRRRWGRPKEAQPSNGSNLAKANHFHPILPIAMFSFRSLNRFDPDHGTVQLLDGMYPSSFAFDSSSSLD